MSNYIFAGTRLNFWIVHGVVLSNQSNGEVWIKASTGKEFRLECLFEPFQMSEGHEVSLIGADSPGNDFWWPLRLRNHDRSQYYDLNPLEDIYKELFKTPHWFWVVSAVLFVPSSLVTLMFGVWWGGLLLPLIFWFALGPSDKRRKAREVEALEAHIDKIDAKDCARRSIARALSRDPQVAKS
ncbi:hypothetical protein [Pseudomonas putida]|uniref:hypothetical protein n=1 Tax=Pseudomonas putida TaxID=303 RepID=UPI0013A6B94F|nr:hypothetical protein [Pseudomonas putida]